MDALEQYSKRNCVRIGPVPESADKNTDEIVKAVAKSVGVDLTDDDIDRTTGWERSQRLRPATDPSW